MKVPPTVVPVAFVITTGGVPAAALLSSVSHAVGRGPNFVGAGLKTQLPIVAATPPQEQHRRFPPTRNETFNPRAILRKLLVEEPDAVGEGAGRYDKVDSKAGGTSRLSMVFGSMMTSSGVSGVQVYSNSKHLVVVAFFVIFLV